MEKISKISPNLSRKKLNPNWEVAAEVAKLTYTSPKRWLRDVSKNLFAVNRALIDFKECYDPTKIKSKVGLMQWLITRHATNPSKSS